MIFKSTPNMLVRITRKIPGVRVKRIRFDANGEFETNNPRLIKLLSAKFSIKEESKEESKTFTCKKCGEQFDNKGKFLAHMREHKRGE